MGADTEDLANMANPGLYDFPKAVVKGPGLAADLTNHQVIFRTRTPAELLPTSTDLHRLGKRTGELRYQAGLPVCSMLSISAQALAIASPGAAGLPREPCQPIVGHSS